jgi:hypothetical protein
VEHAFRPRPSHFRYLRAWCALLEDGRAVTYTAVAHEMGIAKRSLFKMRARYPQLDGWISDQIAARAARLVGPVVARLGMLAIKGSADHAALYLKHVVGTALPGEPPPAPGGNTVIHNGPVVYLAVPRPGDPAVAAPAARVPAIEARR